MIRPLLRVLPSLSGNVKLVCDLDNYHKNSQNDFECFVRSARLSPLSSNLFNKFISVSLLQSSYEWDLRKFFINYSDYFWKTHFNYSKIDLPIYDNTETNRTRNIDFEFGAKRISYSKNSKQFAFFAPIYIDNVNDIPDYFEMTFDINNGVYRSSKKVKVNLSNKSDNPENYLFNYIEHYVKQIDDNVIFCLPNDKQATYWGIDLKSGGFTKISDNTFVKLLKKQTTILNFDNVLCKGFERNNIVMRQVLPFCFYFNINDILSETEKQKYQYSRIDISGKWYKDGKEIDVYDWDIDYTEYYQTIKTLNLNTGLIEYDYLTYQNDKGEKVIQNIMDIAYPALRDSLYDNYRFSNKITPNFCRWKLKYSSDEHPYITNMNVAFSMNQNSLTRYKEFPVKTENTSGLVHTLKQDSHFYNNLILPLTSENAKIYNKYHNQEYNEYKYIQNNFASNWFELMNPSLGVNECVTSNDLFCDVKDNKVYFNGILYDLQKIYDTFNNVPKIDKFGVFITLKYNPITRKNLDKFLYTDNVIFKQFGKYVKNANTFINDNILTDVDTQLFSKLNTSLKTDEISKNNIFIFNDKNTGDFINLSDFNIDYYELNHYFKQEDLEQIIDKTYLPHENRFFNGNEFIPINKVNQIINEQDNDLTVYYSSLEDNPLLCSSKDNYSVINFTPEIISKTEISEKNALSFYQKHNFISKKDLKDILKTTSSEADSLIAYISNNCYHYVWNPILTDNSSFTYAKNCFVKIEGFNARFYGDIIEKDKVKYDNDVLYIDPFNYNNIIDHYNNTWLKYSDEKFSYINFSENSTQSNTLSDYIDTLNSINWYGKFLNKAHLQYFIQYIYDDPNASGIRRKKSVTDIYVRKRFMYDDNNLKIHDVYIPLSEYFNFRNLDNISDTDYNKLINDIVGSIDYNEDDKYFYFNTLNIKNKNNIVKFNYDELLDGEIIDNIIDEQFLDKMNHLINNVELGKTEPQHFKFDLCFKKTFVKMNKEIYKLINLEEELNAPYKDLYVYEFEKDFEYNNNCKIYHILNRYKTIKDTQEVIEEPFYKYLTSERECLKPLFNNIFMEDKEDTKIYCEYSLDNLETDVRVIDSNDNVIDTFVRHNKNNALCLFDTSAFNLDANGNVALEKPITIANKNYFTYAYWSNYLTEEQQQKYAYLYPTYDRYSAKKTYFSQFEITKDVSYYYSESITKTRDILSYTYYTKSAWESLENKPINYDYFFDNEKLMYIYSTWRIKTEEYEEILIKPGKHTYTYVLDDLGLFDSFNLNTYSYFNKDTNKTENYAFYLINVELNNTSSSLNIIKDKDEYVKFIDLINGKDVSENNFIYDIYKQILPFTKNNPLDTLYSGENLMVIPKYYKFPVNYVATSYYDKANELHNDIVFLPKPHDNIVLERYFDNIVPLFRQTESFNSYLLKYKNVNKTFAHSYHTNEVIEKEFISIKNYPGVPIIDINTNKEIKREYDLEYKHYNDNRVYNLPESFDIEIKQLLTYEDLLIAQTKQNTLEQFKKYIYQHSKNQFVDNQILFLFNRYKVDYLHNCDSLTIDLTAKLYKLVYRFTLL